MHAHLHIGTRMLSFMKVYACYKPEDDSTACKRHAYPGQFQLGTLCLAAGVGAYCEVQRSRWSNSSSGQQS